MRSGMTVGIDLVEVDRFTRALRRWPRLRDRIFTDRELAACAGSHNADERLAARFAAKEATFKAVGEGWPAIAYRDVEVTTAGTGAPSLCLRERAATIAGDREVAVSLAHAGGLAVAEVV